MSASFFTQLTKVIQIDEENSVTIAAPTYGEVQEANSRAVRTGLNLESGKPEMDFDSFKMEAELLAVGIKSWSGPGFEGRPVTRENIMALPTWVLDPIKKALNEFTTNMKVAEKKT